jgi:hypothetical protein
MSSEQAPKTKGDKKGGLSDLIKDISPNYDFTYYVKRFFYQIIGIYFPAAILFLYLFLFWYTGSHQIGANQDPINYLAKSNITWPGYIQENLKDLQKDIAKDNPVVELILFLLTIVVLGEGINAVTSRLAKISPVSTSRREMIKYGILRREFLGTYKSAEWPLWLNEISFPVSFAEFDRYYVSALEQDKRTLAGKIGWVSFYRNMVAVFLIVLGLQIILMAILIVTGKKLYGYEYYVLATTGAAILFLLIGYVSQIISNRDIFWDAYKRYQLRKNLEIRYGDLTLAFGVEEKYRARALEYIVDRWFLGVDTTIQTISRWFLTKLEEQYKFVTNSPTNIRTNDINKIEKKVRKKLVDSYSDWNRGVYERVIANTLSSFKVIERSQTIPKDIVTKDEWKTILGFYILENSLRTDAAFVEISTHLYTLGWTNNPSEKGENKECNEKASDNENNKSTTSSKEIEATSFMGGKVHDYYTAEPLKQTKKDLLDQTANIIRETSDDYQKAFFKIMYTLKAFNKLLSEDKLQDAQKKKCYNTLSEIYRLFGGFQYEEAFRKANEFFDGIYYTNTVNVHLTSDGNLYRPTFTGYVTEQVDAAQNNNTAPKDSIITEIRNHSPFNLTNISHTDLNGIKEEFCIRPFLLLKINEDQKRVSVIGEWNVQSIDQYPLPREIHIEIGWKAAGVISI